jgi:hypothetical protein
MVLEYYSQLDGILFKKRPSGINILKELWVYSRLFALLPLYLTVVCGGNRLQANGGKSVGTLR